jgi:fatty acid/phospholipid biosynthesis enzyme
MGSYVTAEKVFLGNNGAGMVNPTYLAKYAENDFSSLNLTDPSVFSDYMEGVAMTLMGIIKQEMMADLRGKLSGLIGKPAFRRVKHLMDYKEVGGAPLLGVQGAVVKAHGSSDAHAFASAIGQCVKMIDGRVVEIIEKGVAALQ